MSYINFESARDKERARKELREARDQLLEKAKQNAERRAERETQKLLSGETNWMLPTVAAKFENSISSSKKKKKKDKKQNKSKKSKKRKYDSSKCSEESSSSDDDENWHKICESKGKKKRKHKSNKSDKRRSSSESINDEGAEPGGKNTGDWIEKPVAEPPLERDNWMMDSSAFSMKTFVRDRVEKKKEEATHTETYNPVRSSRELNPYWKTTGTGLPAFQKPSECIDEAMTRKHSNAKYSGNSGWRKKSVAQVSKSSKLTENRTTSSDSSSNVSDDEENSKDHHSTTNEVSANNFLTDQQMNELGAKILKAEILGNTEAVAELKLKLENARKQRNSIKERKTSAYQIPTQGLSKSKKGDEHVILTRTDEKGNVYPLESMRNKRSSELRDIYGGAKSGRKNSGKRTETHVDGERVRYFPDDDKYDIKQMFEREKYISSAEANLQFANIASKHKNPNDDLEDIFADKISKIVCERNAGKKEMDRAIGAHEKLEAQLENCNRCIDAVKMNKSLIVSMGEKIYLALPWYIGLQAGHCTIVPTQHVSCSTQLDEDSWEEVQNYRKAITRMFAAQQKDVIFFEIANKLHRRPHLSIDCVPIPMNKGESAPFFFKKAIEESEHEWSINKQLVRLSSKRGLRDCIPKGLPYFWVHFGIDSGFAHVIEDQDRFPKNFASEIIGGMLHLENSKWRKPQKEQNYVTKVKIFADSWKKFDFTQ